MLCWPSFPTWPVGVKACSCYFASFFALLRVGSSGFGFSEFQAFLTASLERLSPHPFAICRVFPLSDAWRLNCFLDWSTQFSLETNLVTFLSTFRVALTTLLRSMFALRGSSTFVGSVREFSLSEVLRVCLGGSRRVLYAPDLAFFPYTLAC